MSTEHDLIVGEWDNPSFVLKTPLSDAFLARQWQQAHLPKSRTRRIEDTLAIGTFDETGWIDGIIQDIKKFNAINVVREWFQIFCETWLDRDSRFPDVVDDSMIGEFIRTHWALYTKSESERALAENMMERVKPLLESRENPQGSASSTKKRRRGISKHSRDPKTSKHDPTAEVALPTSHDPSLTPGTLVLAPNEPPKKKRGHHKYAGAYRGPNMPKKDSKAEIALPSSQNPSLTPGTLVLPPTEPPGKKRRHKHAGTYHGSDVSKRDSNAETAPPTSQNPSVIPEALVLAPGEPPKKKRRHHKHAVASRGPDMSKKDLSGETALPTSQDPSLTPEALVLPPTEAPKKKKRGRKRKHASPSHDPNTSKREPRAKMILNISQDLPPTPGNPSLLSSNLVGMEISLDDDGSLGWTKPPSPIPIPEEGRYLSSHVHKGDDDIRGSQWPCAPVPILISTSVGLGPSVNGIPTIMAPPKKPEVLTTLHQSDEVVPAKTFQFITEQTITHPRSAKRLDTVTRPRRTQGEPDNRPLLAAEPHIWAENRGEVSESLDYFRRPQGGVHSRNNMAMGYLLDGYSTNRDYCAEGGEVIISHGGGSMGSEKNGHGIVTAMKSDHNAAERSVKALLNSFKEKKPVAVLIGDRFHGFPFRLQTENRNYRFIVLGWYAVTHAWAYPESNILSTAKVSRPGQATRYMFRFQWLNTQGTPWWRVAESIPTSIPNATDISAPELPAEVVCSAQTSQACAGILTDYGCGSCGGNSPMIFDKPLCLQPSCKLFDKEYFPFDLPYNVDVLHRLALDEHQYAISIPIEPSIPGAEHSTSRRAWDGLVCPTCHKLAQRLHWKGWFCTVCKTYPELANHPLRDAKDFSDLKLTTARKPHLEFPISINLCRTGGGGTEYSGCVYTLPLECKLYHLRPKSQALADDLFHRYQTDAKASELFVRRKLNHPIHGHSQANRHFAFNVGETYNYSSVTQTVSFEESPRCVSDAKTEISNVVLHALHCSVEFNQVLSVAYMEDMAMSYHSDGEVGLGDVVASLSLGSPARMAFRLRNKPGKGAFDNSNVTKEEYEKWFEYARHSCRKTKPRPQESSTPVQTELLCPSLLAIDMQHGDVFIMTGNTQRFYEHEIARVPGFRIAATCRQIKDVDAHANGTPS